MIDSETAAPTFTYRDPNLSRLRTMCARRGWTLGSFIRYALSLATEEGFAAHLVKSATHDAGSDGRGDEP